MQQEEMSFWDHLEELRWTLFRSMGAKIQFVMNSSLIIPNLLPLHRLKKLKLEKN